MANPYTVEVTNDDNSRVIYLCGPHGVGKSTLIESLKEDIINIDIVEQIAHMESLSEMMNRQIWRNTLHIIEHRQNLMGAASKPRSFILGDRSTFDDEAYQDAFLKLGWLSQEEYTNVQKLINFTYELTSTPKPCRFIVVLPPYDWNVARLEERWNEGDELKWRENDLAYLVKVREAFEVKAKELPSENVLILRDTDQQIRVHQVKKWLNSQSLVQGTTYTERQTDYRSNSNSG